MIVVEERLTEAFEQLPEIDGFKPVYKWGNEFHLIKQLELFSKENKSIYPLIYQTSNYSKQFEMGTNECNTKLRLVLACQNTMTDLANENRWAMSYANVLFPLARNIVKTLNGAGIFLWEREYELTEFPNYGKNPEENFTTDIWDALLFEADVKILDTCIQQINFN